MTKRSPTATRRSSSIRRRLYAYSLRAYCNLQKNKIDDALRDCEKAIDLDPSSRCPCSCGRAVMLSRGDSNKAVTDCTTALKLMPNSAWGYSTLALALLKQGRNEEAAAAATKALQMSLPATPSLSRPAVGRSSPCADTSRRPTMSIAPSSWIRL